jgi:hypothetical protein
MAGGRGCPTGRWQRPSSSPGSSRRPPRLPTVLLAATARPVLHGTSPRRPCRTRIRNRQPRIRPRPHQPRIRRHRIRPAHARRAHTRPPRKRPPPRHPSPSHPRSHPSPAPLPLRHQPQRSRSQSRRQCQVHRRVQHRSRLRRRPHSRDRVAADPRCPAAHCDYPARRAVRSQLGSGRGRLQGDRDRPGRSLGPLTPCWRLFLRCVLVRVVPVSFERHR